MKSLTVRISELVPSLLLPVCAFVTFAQSNGPLDSLREQFLTVARQRSAFQPITANVTGRVVSVDDSRRSLYESVAQRQAAASSLMGKYVESVTIDDGQSQSKAVCSAFEQETQPRVRPGESITVSGLFIGAILPGAVELIKCSFTGGGPLQTPVAPGPTNAQRDEKAAPSAVSRSAGGAVSIATLLQEAKGDRIQFTRRYAGQRMIVIGRVTSVYSETNPTRKGISLTAGLFWHSSFHMINGAMPTSQTTFGFYFFAPDGHVYSQFPSNGMLDHFDFAAAAADDAKHTGYYRVSGSRIEFAWAARNRKARRLARTEMLTSFWAAPGTR